MNKVFNCPVYKRIELGILKNKVAKDSGIDRKMRLSNFIVACNAVTPSLVLQENLSRTYLLLKNLDAIATIYISFGSTSRAEDSFNIDLAPGEIRVYQDIIPIQAIYAISNSGTPKLSCGVA